MGTAVEREATTTKDFLPDALVPEKRLGEPCREQSARLPVRTKMTLGRKTYLIGQGDTTAETTSFYQDQHEPDFLLAATSSLDLVKRGALS
jgi:hypothetical protein